ncbi:hypothetical protein E3N88_30085 [Mikania micrantha]|uniref:Uncharacterized protein n=1 Tax=Mikania micrantha TaxID=192012 RepID=A0A5N6MLD3_9ASTR|nr:hypothetical protein E3N88_30085 [Mikania micrantha]
MIHVPFSWEKRPGVPKFITSPMHIFAPDQLNRNHREVKRETALPLPPGSSRNPVSESKRTFVMEEDPFVAAMITCTRDCDMFKSKVFGGFEDEAVVIVANNGKLGEGCSDCVGDGGGRGPSRYAMAQQEASSRCATRVAGV